MIIIWSYDTSEFCFLQVILKTHLFRRKSAALETVLVVALGQEVAIAQEVTLVHGHQIP